ncbi:hypothetical protein ES332_D04G052700v1 [Gossypium tomentosum]|uniref:Uncharacterized protein n=1 Tax=Gossypium tomentosum TaxID=34277 RepID=A0A5D2LA46_GOSTO|nr:hypothetical protein ES332_D04G052700v1 [Gossypium tomentosum]
MATKENICMRCGEEMEFIKNVLVFYLFVRAIRGASRFNYKSRGKGFLGFKSYFLEGLKLSCF